MTNVSRSLRAVGMIVKPFGLRGEMVIRPFTDSVERFRELTSVYVGADDAGATAAVIQSVKIENRGVRVQLSQVNDRTTVEQMVGSLLFVDEAHAQKLPHGRYFIDELIGLEVVDDKHGRIGIVKDVLKFPANDIYVIEAGGREVMVPAVREFVREIDVDKKIIRVKLIEGMLEL